MKHFYQHNCLSAVKIIFRSLTVGLLICIQNFSATAQCPPNIDFEMGDFSGWQCYVGTFNGGRVIPLTSLTPSPPTANRHEMLSSVPGNGPDPYGNFPQNCPNGSGYSIKLGNNQTGRGAEAVSYTFTIPATQNKFSLIYSYAMVLNDGGSGHDATSQPRMQVTIDNITDGTPLPCPLDPFVVGSSLQGFLTSVTPGPGNSPVLYRDWVSSSINLDNLAGKTIRIAFITADCSLGGHFGYAYVDVNPQCSSSFVGATFCPDDTAVIISAPPGYETYTWYDGLMGGVIGTGQILTLNPPPLAGDSVNVVLSPFAGYGCTTTLTAILWDTLTVKANAGPDRETCDNNPVQLGGPATPGLVYRWTPTTGLSNPNISNPIATPSVSTTYTLTVTNSGGGCATPDVVNVDVDILSDSIELIGVASYCTGSGQAAALKVLPHDNIQWYRNNVAIPGAAQTLLNITQTGAYYAIVSSSAGCNRTTAVKQIDIWETPVAKFSPNIAVQCFTGNQFVFTNNSTLTTGVLQYAWDLGDGTTTNTRNVSHNYIKEGTYKVRLIATAPGGCVDSSKFDVVVNASPAAAFAVDVPEQCFKNNWFVFTNKSTVSSGTLTYTWDFGDGNFDNSNDIAHGFAVAGNYTVKLTAKETNGGCSYDSSFPVIVHQSPVTNFTIDNDIQCFPGHQFVLTNGTTILSDTLLYTWSMGDGIIKTAKDFNYSYAKDGRYIIQLIANTTFGCRDSATRNVTVHPTPAADFSVQPVCENLRVPVINRTFNNTASTINYLWDFGNGHLDNVMTPNYSYPAGGKYTVRLTVSTVQCPVSFNTKSIDVAIETVKPGIVYPDKDAAFNYPEPLQARQFGNSVIWTPPTNLNNRFSFTPIFNGITPQLYTIQIKTSTGCLTVDTQLVKTHKKIDIYVPTGFTPNGNGVNDRLRPVLVGFSKVNYFRIYNRWGKLLFSMNSDQPGWDGKVNNKPAEMQTVVWMIEAVDVDGKVHNRQGTTVVIR